MRIIATVLVALSLAASLHADDPLPLWDAGAMPGKATANPERVENDHIYEVSAPTVAFYPAPNPKGRPLPTVLISPGGGYACLDYWREGVEPALWLNQRGLNAAVLKYRVPGDRGAALDDARRAVELLKARAGVWKIDPKRIGVMGFSAGAHLSARLLARQDHGLAFAILYYPAYLSTDGNTLAEEVVPATPAVPVFIAQCADDRAYVLSSLAYAGHLLRAGKPVAYHLFARGGHGFGFRTGPNPELRAWADTLEGWLRANRL